MRLTEQELIDDGITDVMDKANNTYKVYQRCNKLYFQDLASCIRPLYPDNKCLAFKKYSIDEGKSWLSIDKEDIVIDDKMTNKINIFKLVVYFLKKWSNYDITNCNTLRIQKLLFLVCAEDDYMLDVFDNFYSTPYGMIEYDIHQLTINNTISIPDIVTEDIKKSQYDKKVYNRVKKAIDNLKEKNSDLITMSAFQLVNLLQKWSCWIMGNETGIENGDYIWPIPRTVINDSTRFYKERVRRYLL